MQIVLFLRRETNANPLSQTRQIPSWQLEQFVGQVGLADVVGSETKPVKETFISLILFIYLFIFFI